MSATFCLSEERDIPLLEFLWRWKVAPTAALGERFFGGARCEWAYRRLKNLEARGYVQTRAGVRGVSFVWMLDQRGFGVVKSRLPELREDGFRSENIDHDLLVSAFHLGDWLSAIPEGIEVFTEQELRRYHHDLYPSWVPRSDLHRPDGYWNLPFGNVMKAVALEVELSHQRQSRYEVVGEFYRRFRGISKVIWLVPRLSLGEHIHRALTDGHTAKGGYHDFLTVTAFKKCGWGARIEIGPDQGKTVQETLGHMDSTKAPQVESMWMLETRKSPHRSGHSRRRATTAFCV